LSILLRAVSTSLLGKPFGALESGFLSVGIWRESVLKVIYGICQKRWFEAAMVALDTR